MTPVGAHETCTVARVLDDVRGWSAWQNAGAVLRQAIGDFYARPCRPSAPAPSRDRAEAAIDLTGAGYAFELTIALERRDLRALATSMLGVSDEADALSLLLETANIAMGRLQASLISGGWPCTLALPRLGASRRAPPLTSSFHVVCRGAVIDLSLSCALNENEIRPFTNP